MKSLLILRPDNIGDCVLFSGTLRYYRELFPDYKIVLAIKSNIIPLFEYCPYIDKTINYKKYSYKKNKSIIGRIINILFLKLIFSIVNILRWKS